MQRDYKFAVSVYMKGVTLEPAQVTAQLGVEPSKSQSYGESTVTSTNRLVTAKTGLWALIMEQESKDLVGLVKELVAKLGDQAFILRKMPGIEEAYLTFRRLTNEYHRNFPPVS